MHLNSYILNNVGNNVNNQAIYKLSIKNYFKIWENCLFKKWKISNF